MTATAIMIAALVTMIAIPGVKASGEGTQLQLLCSPGLSEMAQGLVDEYTFDHPDALIRVNHLPEGGLEGELQEGTLALVNKECISGMDEEFGFRMVVGRDVIVPVINSGNPYREEIMQHGISPEGFSRIFTSEGKVTWGDVSGGKGEASVTAFIPAGTCNKAYLAEFIHTTPGQLTSGEISGTEDILGSIRSHKNSIGFVSLAVLVQLEAGGGDAGISLVPVDKNGNGQVDQFEDIYRSSGDLSHGIFVGKYPRALYSRVYAVAGEQPVGEQEVAFLEWMINRGQESLASAGIMGLEYSERNAGMQVISGQPEVKADVTVMNTSTRNSLLVTMGLLVLVLLAVVLTGRSRRKRLAVPVRESRKPGVFGQDTVAFPGGLYFDRSHTWTFLEKDGKVRIGIDDFMQHVTGHVTRVIMKDNGEKVTRGEPFLTLVQNGKQLQINSPVSGTMVAKNTGLLKDASLVNSDPYEGGWICMVQPVNWIAELKTFFMGDPYTDWLKTEFARLKEFLTSGMKIREGKELSVVLQDGGEIRDGALEEFGPEVWEEFQSRFINQ